MGKEAMELTVDQSVDVWKLVDYLRRIQGVTKAYVVTMQAIRLYYNPEKIAGKRLVKLVGSYNNHSQRKKNILHLKSIEDHSSNEAA